MAVSDVLRLLSDAGGYLHYRNSPTTEIPRALDAYYGADGLERLRQAKRRYDPQDRIRHTQSVRPELPRER